MVAWAVDAVVWVNRGLNWGWYTWGVVEEKLTVGSVTTVGLEVGLEVGWVVGRKVGRKVRIGLYGELGESVGEG